MKRVLIISGIVIAVLLIAVALTPLFINVDSFRPDLEKKLTAALNRNVTIGKLDASIFSGGATASEISIADDPAFNKGPFLKASSVKVGVELMPLIFSKQLKVTSLTVEKPEITLLEDAAGKWNYATLGATEQKTTAEPAGNAAGQKTAPAQQAQKTAPSQRPAGNATAQKTTEPSSGSAASNITVDKFEIVDGTLKVGHSSGHSAGKESVYQNVNLVAQSISAQSAMPFTLTVALPNSGSLSLEGQAGPLNPTDSTKTPLDAKLTVKHADIAATGFVDPSSALAGIVDFNGQIKSDGKTLHSEGTATANSLRVVKGGQAAKQAVSLDYKSDYALTPETGSISANVHTGKSVTNASGTVNTKGEDTLANLKITGKDMQVNDVEGLLPAFGVILPSGASLQGGTINLNLTAEGPLDRLVINGPVSISNTHLSGYNLGSKLGALASFTGSKSTSTDTLIQTFSSTVHMAPDGIQANNIVLDVPSMGNLTGNGVISSDNSLNFKMLLKFTGGAGNTLGSLTGGLVGGAQSSGLPFLIEGKTTNPEFRPDLNSAVKSNLQNGLMQALQGKNGNQQGQQKPDLKGVLGGLLGKKKPQ
jgi:AsmA protein